MLSASFRACARACSSDSRALASTAVFSFASALASAAVVATASVLDIRICHVIEDRGDSMIHHNYRTTGKD